MVIRAVERLSFLLNKLYQKFGILEYLPYICINNNEIIFKNKKKQNIMKAIKNVYQLSIGKYESVRTQVFFLSPTGVLTTEKTTGKAKKISLSCNKYRQLKKSKYGLPQFFDVEGAAIVEFLHLLSCHFGMELKAGEYNSSMSFKSTVIQEDLGITECSCFYKDGKPMLGTEAPVKTKNKAFNGEYIYQLGDINFTSSEIYDSNSKLHFESPESSWTPKLLAIEVNGKYHLKDGSISDFLPFEAAEINWLRTSYGFLKKSGKKRIVASKEELLQAEQTSFEEDGNYLDVVKTNLEPSRKNAEILRLFHNENCCYLELEDRKLIVLGGQFRIDQHVKFGLISFLDGKPIKKENS